MDGQGGSGFEKPAARQPPWPAPLVAPLPAGRFKKHEEWAWARIANGRPADMALYPGDDADPAGAGWLEGKWSSPPDPQKADSFKPHHTLSELFLRTILFHEPWASAPEGADARVEHALIEDPIDWSARETKGGLWLESCRFSKDIVWMDLHVRRVLSLQRSVLARSLRADRIKVGGSLFCRDKFTAEGQIRLLGAHIGSNAEFTGATLKDTLQADGMQVEGVLFFSDGFIAKQDVRIISARIGGGVSFIGATLNGGLNASRVQVRDFFFLREMRCLGIADLSGLSVGSALHLRESIFEGKVDLTGAHIGGELHLDLGMDAEQNVDTRPTWKPGASLILRNAACGALAGQLAAFRQNRTKARPKGADFVPLDLTGFTYERLGGLKAAHKDTLAGAEARDLCAWLEAGRGDGAFNPGPYRQLARTLQASGDAGKARRVLHAMAGHEADAARGWRRLEFFFSWLFIDYGYSNVRAILWFLSLVLGYVALGLSIGGVRPFDFSDAGFAEFFRWLGFSFANAVPLISFDKAHETFLAAQFGTRTASGDPDLASVPVAIAWAFYMQKTLGFIILSYLAAGLSGLARARLEKD